MQNINLAKEKSFRYRRLERTKNFLQKLVTYRVSIKAIFLRIELFESVSKKIILMIIRCAHFQRVKECALFAYT